MLERRSLLQALATGGPISAPVAVVVAHQDDEIIGMGGVMCQFRALTLIHQTDGVPYQSLDISEDERDQRFKVRNDEVTHAMRVAGACIVRRVNYRFPDGRLADHVGESVNKLITDLMAVDFVVTHPFEGGHLDHDACSQSVFHACDWLLRNTGAAPKRLEFSSYFFVNGEVKTGGFQPNSESLDGVSVALTSAAQFRKQAAFGCFRSQRDNLRFFSTSHERFRIAPDYNFTS